MRISGNHSVIPNKVSMKTDKHNKKATSEDLLSHAEKIIVEKKNFSGEDQLKDTLNQLILNFVEKNRR